MEKLPGNAFYIELPEKLLSPDEKPYLDANLPQETNKKSNI